jgi:predicted Zn-dependent protease with MMP-like domain
LYEGIPKTKRWHYSEVLPDKITIFKKPIERTARSEDEAKRTSSLLHLHPATRESVMKEIIKNTVWHEIAHHFGMDEKRIKEAETILGRRIYGS